MTNIMRALLATIAAFVLALGITAPASAAISLSGKIAVYGDSDTGIMAYGTNKNGAEVSRWLGLLQASYHYGIEDVNYFKIPEGCYGYIGSKRYQGGIKHALGGALTTRWMTTYC